MKFFHLYVVEEHKSIFEPLTSEVSVNVCKGTSKRERQEMKLGANSLVYGETLYDGFAITLEKIKKRFGIEDRIMQGSSGGGLFYDLGSGDAAGIVCSFYHFLHSLFLQAVVNALLQQLLCTILMFAVELNCLKDYFVFPWI